MLGDGIKLYIMLSIVLFDKYLVVANSSQ